MWLLCFNKRPQRPAKPELHALGRQTHTLERQTHTLEGQMHTLERQTDRKSVV